MLKKLPISLVIALTAFATYGQTIVSTSPENKNVVLEEYTGIYCGFCPQGHAIAQSLQDANPDRVSLINIHQGGYANPSGNDPDFRTQFGTAIVGQSYSGGNFGYPAGSVNRHEFPGRSMASGGGTAMSRNYWTVSANEILAQASPVNIAVEASIDVETNVMNIHVEAYYTGNSPEATNLLNVVLLQNNTKGPQSGGNQGNNYNHMHRLIDMVTGQWGEEITQTTAGTYVERDYAYNIIPHNNMIPVEIGDLEVVAFITESRQEITSGSRTIPTATVTNSNDANLRFIAEIEADCAGEEFSFTPEVNIQNTGSEALTALNIEYSINGTSNTYAWTGNIASLKSENVELPEVTLTLLDENTFEVSIPNDDYNDNNSLSVPVGAPSVTGTVDLVIETDNNGDEVRYRIKNSSGTTVASGGPYGNNQTYYERINLDEDCYTFSLIDTGQNGGNVVTLTDNEGKEIFHTDGNYSNLEVTKFLSNGVLGTNQVSLENINLYPNPAKNVLNITNGENADIQIFDLLGKMILSKNDISMNEQLDVAKFQTGTYFIKISKDNNVTTKRFLISK